MQAVEKGALQLADQRRILLDLASQRRIENGVIVEHAPVYAGDR